MFLGGTAARSDNSPAKSVMALLVGKMVHSSLHALICAFAWYPNWGAASQQAVVLCTFDWSGAEQDSGNTPS